jgi:hypothetical protein
MDLRDCTLAERMVVHLAVEIEDMWRAIQRSHNLGALA